MSEQAQQEESTQPEGPQVSIEFICDQKTGVLTALVKDADTPLALNLAYMRELLERFNFQDFFFEQGALQDLLSEILEGGRGIFHIGQRRDANVTITISQDTMHALASTEPACGGAPLSAELVKQALTDAGIHRTRWLDEEIEELVKKPAATDFEIATGKLPEKGADSQFVPLVQGIVQHLPIDEPDNFNPYDVLDFIVVEPGTPVMRREPATDGVAGMDVRGKILPSTPGKTADFGKGMNGVVLDEEDENLLVAATKGHPVMMPNGVRLDPSLKLESADRRTGNVSFDGSIQITGDVAAGVSIEATGDVVIKGTVEEANIQSGADIMISGGIINPNVQVDEDTRSILMEAGGDIHAKFVTGASMRAGRNVVIKEYIGFCDVDAGEQVLVGQSGGKGRIYGGRCHGHNGVLANGFGSNAGAATLISAGAVAAPSEEQAELNDAMESLEEQCKKIQLLLENMSCSIVPPSESDEQTPADPDAPAPTDAEMCKKLANTMSAFEAQQEEIRQSLADLQAENTEDVSICAAKTVRGGVSLRINGVQRNFKVRDAGGTFKLREGSVVRVE